MVFFKTQELLGEIWNYPLCTEGKEKLKKGTGPLHFVGGGVNKQGNLYTRFVSGAPTCQKLKSLDRSIYGVQSCTLSQHIILTGVSLKITGWGNGGQNVHSKDHGGCEEPLTAWVQCSVQLLCPLWPPPTARCDCIAFSTDTTLTRLHCQEKGNQSHYWIWPLKPLHTLPFYLWFFTRTMWLENSLISWNIPFKYCFLFETVLIPSHRANFALISSVMFWWPCQWRQFSNKIYSTF